MLISRCLFGFALTHRSSIVVLRLRKDGDVHADVCAYPLCRRSTMLLVTLLCHLLLKESHGSPPDFCPPHAVFAKGVSDECEVAKDPNHLKKSPIEKWFTEEMFNDLFPKANLGLGPHECLPYSYKSFIIAARYFPEFGGEGSSK
ncbi:hypothetical protein GCK32_019306, partial [Trichostrongylus colubriformis]